jgi:uncharacterized coiled-coil DUF342 family protein
MNANRIEALLETLIEEIRLTKDELKAINTELNWWDEKKHTFAGQLLKRLDEIDEVKYELKKINEELIWWDKSKSSLARELLDRLDRIERSR